MPPTSLLPILAPRVQNAFLRDFHTALDDKFNLTNNGAGNLADFLALVFKHLERQGEAVSTNFRRALTDFALLGAILHITRYTLCN